MEAGLRRITTSKRYKTLNSRCIHYHFFSKSLALSSPHATLNSRCIHHRFLSKLLASSSRHTTHHLSVLSVPPATIVSPIFPSIPQSKSRWSDRNCSFAQSILLQSEQHRQIHSMATGSTTEDVTPHDRGLSGVEASKRRAAFKAVEDHFDPSYRYIGIGSGSTVVYVVEAIAAKGRAITSKQIFVPTGDQSKQLIIEAGLQLGGIDSLPPVSENHPEPSAASALSVATGMQDLGLKGKRQSLDVAFDGADEIDEDLNCIKGGGACLFQEKLVATAAKKFICVADYRKLQPRLLTNWKTIPIEISPLAAPTIKRILITLGSPDPKIRQGGSAKAGPVVTDNGMWIIDAPFPPLLISSDLKAGQKGDGEDGAWEVHQLGRRLKRIVGVLEVGLFHGRNGAQVANNGEEGGGQKPIAAYFGMENGEVEVRTAEDSELVVKSRP